MVIWKDLQATPTVGGDGPSAFRMAPMAGHHREVPRGEGDVFLGNCWVDIMFRSLEWMDPGKRVLLSQKRSRRSVVWWCICRCFIVVVLEQRNSWSSS